MRIGLRIHCGCWMLAAGVMTTTPYPTLGQPARTRALSYDVKLKEWIETPAPPLGTAAGDLHAVRVLIKDGGYEVALDGILAFVARYGESNPHYPELLIAQGEALIGMQEYDKAHEVLQSFLSKFGGMSMTSDALRLEFVIAEAFLGGIKHKIGGIRMFSGTDLALEILDEIAFSYPDSQFAELAIKTKADHFFNVGDHTLAEMEYARMLRDHPQSRYYAYCLRRSADSALAGFAGVDYDQRPLIEAGERYREIRLANPAKADSEGIGLILDGIEEAGAEKDFSIGMYYERTGHLSSAVYYYQLLRRERADSVAATKAATRLELLGLPVPAIPSGPDQGRGN